MKFFKRIKKKHKNEKIAEKISKIIENVENAPKWSKETPHKLHTDVIIDIEVARKLDGSKERRFKPTLVVGVTNPVLPIENQPLVGSYPEPDNLFGWELPDNENMRKLRRVFED